MANALGIFGSIDANRGDHQNGWDTDQFPNSVEEMTLAMLEVFRAGGFKDGGFNFDSKVRRQSTDAKDLFYGHVGAIDVIAKGLLNAAALIEDGRLDAARDGRVMRAGTMLSASRSPRARSPTSPIWRCRRISIPSRRPAARSVWKI